MRRRRASSSTSSMSCGTLGVALDLVRKSEYQGPEVHAPRPSGEPFHGWPASPEDLARRQQTAPHGVPAQRIVRATLELYPRGLGAALLRELADGPESGNARRPTRHLLR